MPVTARSGGFQASVHHAGARYRRQFETRAEALAWEAQTKAALLRGESVSVPGLAGGGATNASTLATLMEAAASRYWDGRPGEKTARHNAASVVSLLGSTVHPDRVTHAAVEGVINTLKARGNSNATINRKLAALSKMLRYGHDLGVVRRVPKIERLREGVGRERIVSEAEEREALAFFDHIGARDMADLFAVLIDTGLRLGEALSLTPDRIHAGAIHLRARDTKAGRARSIPLTSRAAGILNLRSRYGCSRLFEPLTQSAVTTCWNRLRSHLGVTDPEFVPHALRHTFCSRLAMRGAPAKAIMELAGHSSLLVTQRYMNLSPASLAQSVALLEQGAA